MTRSNSGEPRPVARQGWWATGGWYVPLTVLTVGLAAWVPFMDAARKLNSSRLRWLTGVYAAAVVAILACSMIAPTDAQGNPVGVAGNVLSTVAGVGGLLLIVVACAHQLLLRRRVRAAADNVDEAVTEVLVSRHRRNEARRMAIADPLMAHDLHVGRPDLPRTYDDGGLVDLNSAPATAIAQICGLDQATAEKIVEVRDQQGSGFSNVDEMFVLVDIPVPAWDRVKDRGVTLPA